MKHVYFNSKNIFIKPINHVKCIFGWKENCKKLIYKRIHKILYFMRRFLKEIKNIKIKLKN
jgi:hypothetical protein